MRFRDEITGALHKVPTRRCLERSYPKEKEKIKFLGVGKRGQAHSGRAGSLVTIKET